MLTRLRIRPTRCVECVRHSRGPDSLIDSLQNDGQTTACFCRVDSRLPTGTSPLHGTHRLILSRHQLSEALKRFPPCLGIIRVRENVLKYKKLDTSASTLATQAELADLRVHSKLFAPSFPVRRSAPRSASRRTPVRRSSRCVACSSRPDTIRRHRWRSTGATFSRSVSDRSVRPHNSPWRPVATELRDLRTPTEDQEPRRCVPVTRPIRRYPPTARAILKPVSAEREVAHDLRDRRSHHRWQPLRQDQAAVPAVRSVVQKTGEPQTENLVRLAGRSRFRDLRLSLGAECTDTPATIAPGPPRLTCTNIPASALKPRVSNVRTRADVHTVRSTSGGRRCRSQAPWPSDICSTARIDVDALPNDMADVLRWHSRCPWEQGHAPCLIALWTDAITAEPRAIHRIAISPKARAKSIAWPMARSQACVIRLWPDEVVEYGLVIGEGIETTLAAATRIEHRKTLLQPAWACGCSSNVRAFRLYPASMASRSWSITTPAARVSAPPKHAPCAGARLAGR